MSEDNKDKIFINGEYYKLTVFKIINRDEKNRPEECTMVPDDRSVEITGNEEFFTAYVHESMFSDE